MKTEVAAAAVGSKKLEEAEAVLPSDAEEEEEEEVGSFAEDRNCSPIVAAADTADTDSDAGIDPAADTVDDRTTASANETADSDWEADDSAEEIDLTGFVAGTAASSSELAAEVETAEVEGEEQRWAVEVVVGLSFLTGVGLSDWRERRTSPSLSLRRFDLRC